MSDAPRHPLSRLARLIVALPCLLIAAIAGPAIASAGVRVHESTGATSSSPRDEAARVARFWTPARMRGARPLDLTVGAGPTGAPSARLERGNVASISNAIVPDTTVPPFTVIGRVFFTQGRVLRLLLGDGDQQPDQAARADRGALRQLGPAESQAAQRSGRGTSMFVPAYNDDVAPFGAFVARRNKVFALRQWTRGGNPDYDVGAFLTTPNAERTERRRRGRRRRHDRHRPGPPAAVPDLRLSREKPSECRSATRPTSATTRSPTRSRAPDHGDPLPLAPRLQRRRLADRTAARRSTG